MIPRFDFARRMARQYLRKYRVTRPPVEVEVILFEEDVRVETVVYPDETAGESWWEEGVAHIAVNRHHPRARQRFTLAHEFGHLAMRHHEHPARPSPQQLRSSAPADVCGQARLSRSSSTPPLRATGPVTDERRDDTRGP